MLPNNVRESDKACRMEQRRMVERSVITWWRTYTIRVVLASVLPVFAYWLLVPLSKGQGTYKATGPQLDGGLLGKWILVRTLAVVTDPEKVAVKYYRRYAEWQFSKDGTAAVTVTYRFKEVRKDLKWRTFIRDGIHLLELLDGEETFLMARYEMKKDELWLAISLDPKAVKTDPPKTFDPEKESEALFVVLRRPPQKK